MNILIDTGFWYAFYDESDPYHRKAVEIMLFVNKHTILIPFPSLYETINTRFAKRKKWMDSFRSLINSPSCVLIPDDEYKRDTLVMTLNSSLEKNRPISLVDMVIRQMLDDVNLKSDAIITFNPEDFYDICLSRNIILISDSNMLGLLN
jgi:predicted nucleic acid-binding protein